MSFQVRCLTCGQESHWEENDSIPMHCRNCGRLLSTGLEPTPDTLDYGRQTNSVAPSFQLPLIARGFRLLGELGRGGMGLVYRARQLNLNRDVALKVLPPVFASDLSRLERFRNEAKVAACLTDSHILPVFDVLELDGVPILVLPFIDGSTLGREIEARRIERQQLPKNQVVPSDRAYLERILPLLDQLIAAVTVLHQANIIHRDIKPGNLLVDRQGHLWLADFGLARLGQQSQGTLPGAAVGTAGYMSPEAVAGRPDVDARADLFSVGATLYKALTLQLPYEPHKVAPSSGPPPRPSRLQPLLTRDLDAVLGKALEGDVRRRYQSAQELREDWQRVRAGQAPKACARGLRQRLGRWTGRHYRSIALGLLFAGLVAALGFTLLTAPLPPPNDGAAPPGVYVTTEPTGAQIVLVPVDDYGELQPAQRIRVAGTTPVLVPQVPPGEYLVVTRVAGHGFHEVYRLIPSAKDKPGPWNHNGWREGASGTIVWPKIVIPNDAVTEGMVFLRGGKFLMGNQARAGLSSHNKSLYPAHLRETVPFYLDVTEVTVAAYQQFRGTIPEAMNAKFPKRPPDFDAFPVTGVSFRVARDYAEGIGKRLPTEVEYEFAATDEGRRDYPWGMDAGPVNEKLWQLAAVRTTHGMAVDRTPSQIFGLYSNALEWTDSLPTPYEPAIHPAITRTQYGGETIYHKYKNSRVVRGGPMTALSGRPLTKEEILVGPRFRIGLDTNQTKIAVGFRCARSAQARFLD